MFRAASTAVLVDYRGVTVPQVTELRRQIRAAGANYRVVKNTLARRAAAGTTFESLPRSLQGRDGRRFHRRPIRSRWRRR